MPPVASPPADGSAPPAAAASERVVPRVWLSAAKRRGRWLFLDLRVGADAMAHVVVKQGGKAVARAKPRRVGRGKGTVAFRLGRKLAHGRYSALVKTHADGERKARDPVPSAWMSARERAKWRT